MDITIKSNIQKSPYLMLGNGMIVFGILGIINAVLNFAIQWMIYRYIYSDGFDSFFEWYSIIAKFSLLLTGIGEVVAIVIFLKTANDTHIAVFKQLVILHIVYVVYLIGYYFFFPQIMQMFFPRPWDNIQTYTLIYSIAGFGITLILVIGDWFLYQLCKKILLQYPIKMTFILYLPFVLITFRLISVLCGYIFRSSVLYVVFDGFYIIIPVFWILLGTNFKSIAPLSENTIRYPVGEPRLDRYNLQGGQERIGINPRNMTAASNPYGNCSQCGKPRISQTEVFCSNCGNRF